MRSLSGEGWGGEESRGNGSGGRGGEGNGREVCIQVKTKGLNYKQYQNKVYLLYCVNLQFQ